MAPLSWPSRFAQPAAPKVGSPPSGWSIPGHQLTQTNARPPLNAPDTDGDGEQLLWRWEWFSSNPGHGAICTQIYGWALASMAQGCSLGYRFAELQRCKVAVLRGSNVADLLGCRLCRFTGLQRCRVAGLHGRSVVGLQPWKFAGLRSYRAMGLQRCRSIECASYRIHPSPLVLEKHQTQPYNQAGGYNSSLSSPHSTLQMSLSASSIINNSVNLNRSW